MKILETERLILRHVTKSDSEFVLDLLNQPSFIEFIGDRQVRNISQAEHYIETRFAKSYEDHGFGMYSVDLKEDNVTVGICGFVKRDNLPHADIGFAFLPDYWNRGYALESAKTCLNYGSEVLGFTKILAITTQDNFASGKLLEKLGLRFENLVKMSDEEELKLFSIDLDNRAVEIFPAF